MCKERCVFAAVEAVIAIVEPNGPSSLPVRVVMRANPDPAASFYCLAACQSDAAEQGIAIGPGRHIPEQRVHARYAQQGNDRDYGNSHDELNQGESPALSFCHNSTPPVLSI